MRIYNKNKVPKYIQIYDWVHAMLRKGRLEVGDQLPTEPALVRQFDTSRMTVRKAIDPLVIEGIVERRRGQGTFVVANAPRQLTYNAGAPTSFSEDMLKIGVQPTIKRIKSEMIQANNLVSGYLELTKDTRVVYLKTLLFADDEPVIVDRSYLPYKEFSGLLEMDLSVPLAKLLHERLYVSIQHVRQFLGAVNAGPGEMELFGVSDPIACISMEWIGYDENNIPSLVSLCHYRGDAYKFKIPTSELVRSGII